MNSLKRIAIAQMRSTNDTQQNFQVIKSLVQKASSDRALMAFFPQNFHWLGLSSQLPTPQSLDGPTILKYRNLAIQNNIWLSLGGFQQQSDSPPLYYNTHLIIDSQGQIQAVYRKLHLFDISVNHQNTYKQSNKIKAGSEIVHPIDSPIGKLGLSICFDLRFPQLYRNLVLQGAQILLVPSAFLQKTGYAHWQPLLRARAIQNGCYVVASAQEGRHTPNRVSYGHSCVVDPWGIVNACSSSGPRLMIVDLDNSLVESARTAIPSLNLRRTDLYQQQSSNKNSSQFYEFRKREFSKYQTQT